MSLVRSRAGEWNLDPERIGICGFSAGGETAAQSPTAPAAASAPASRIGEHPNINGIWQAMNSANWDLEPHSAGAKPLERGDRLLGAIGAVPAGLGVVHPGAHAIGAADGEGGAAARVLVHKAH